MNLVTNTRQRIPLEQGLVEQLEDFSWRVRSLLGGDLLAVVAQKPAWPSARLNRMLLNVLVLVADQRVPAAERLYQQYILHEGLGQPFPVDFIGYQEFAEKADLGDPSAVFLCTDGNVIYDSEGAYRRLQDKFKDLNRPVDDVERLQDYLGQKRDAHYQNVGLLLARLLNEIYMGTAAGLTREAIGVENNLRISSLRDLAQWEGLKQRLMRERGLKNQDLVSRIEKLLDDIIWLIARSQNPTDTPKPLNYGQDILEALARFRGKMNGEEE
jgi:hypothetical protein